MKESNGKADSRRVQTKFVCFPLWFNLPKLNGLEVHPPAEGLTACILWNVPVCICNLCLLCGRGLGGIKPRGGIFFLPKGADEQG